jgi:hypothetical protein
VRAFFLPDSFRSKTEWLLKGGSGPVRGGALLFSNQTRSAAAGDARDRKLDGPAMKAARQRGYEATREAAMAAFAKSWRRE